MEIDGISRVVASEGEGACIGELALLSSGPSSGERRRGASVIAKTQVPLHYVLVKILVVNILVVAR
jgi:hypothetical protein